MKIVKRTMNWVKTPTAWEQSVINRAKRAEHIKRFEEQQAMLRNQFATIRENQTAGTVEITARIAAQRILKSV